MSKHRLLLSTAAAAFVAFGVAAPASAETLNVVASFTVLADVVKQVGGDHVKVSSLVGPNGDPHEFEPSPADAKKLNAAKVTFVSGEGLEGWMDRLISASGYIGLISSYHLEFASGPTIIITASIIYGFSILFAPSGIARRFIPRPHLRG